VVLLGAISQHEIALGLLLIVVFSLGLAATLTALGIAVVFARGLRGRWRPEGRIAYALAAAPAISAVLIVALGCLLTDRALPAVI
jgi:ABC-type nickel/cobalt efflux system permease component RcnA